MGDAASQCPDGFHFFRLKQMLPHSFFFLFRGQAHLYFTFQFQGLLLKTDAILI